MATGDSKFTVKERVKLFQGSFEPTNPPKLATQDIDRPLKQEHHAKKHLKALFKEPLQFIFTDEETGKLRCDENTMKLLSEVDQPLNVVAITGLYRTGKSYLLNRLVGEKGKFKTGHKIHACTKGIWILCRNHPTQEGQILVLLDVEGFGDIDKVNRKEHTWLFTLATLLSSTLVYNNKGTLDSYALDRLGFLEEIDSTIQVSQELEEDKILLDLDFFFPSFVVALRDFGLELVNRADEPITPDKYLEDLLVQIKGQGENVKQYNKIRLLIRRYFKKRKCFVFIQPCGPKAKLEKLPDHEIEPDFLTSVREFSNYIFERKPLQLKSGRSITGRMYANLAMHYVSSMGQNEQPSILEATRYMVQKENQDTVNVASDIYQKEMQHHLEKTLPGDEALVYIHEMCLSKSLEYFKKYIIFDDQDVYQKKTMEACQYLLSIFKGICNQKSTNACNDAIERLNKRVEKKLKAGTYNCESGYDDYIQDINSIVREFTSLAGLGSKSKEILQRYLDQKEEEEDNIHQMVEKVKKGKKGTEPLGPIQEHATKRIEVITQSMTRLQSFRQSLQISVDTMESNMNQLLEERHTSEKKTIQESYLENLNFKLNELERQRSEKEGVKESLKEIEDEIAYLQKIYEYAKNADETLKVAPADDKAEKQVQDNMDRIGIRPNAEGTNAEHFFEEKESSVKKSRRKLCKVQ